MAALRAGSIWNRCAAFGAAEQAGVQKNAKLDHRGRHGRRKARKEYPAVEGAGRCFGGIWTKWRGNSARARVPTAASRLGLEGINNVKWLRRIKVVDQPYMGMMERTVIPSPPVDGKARWFQFELGPRSVITGCPGRAEAPGAGIL